MSNKKELTCIGCPMGCQISAELDEEGHILSLAGFTCKVGENYVKEELTAPKRMVTALVRLSGGREPLSVKTSKPIDKKLVFDCLRAAATVSVLRPVKIGEVILPHVCDTDVDLIATSEVL